MRMRVALMAVVLTAVSILGPSGEGAQAGLDQRTAQIYEKSNAVLEKWAGRDDAKLDQELAKLGWKGMETKAVDDVSIASATYCGTAKPLRAYLQPDGRWLVVGQWAWNDASCSTTWLNDTPMDPEDAIVMGITDNLDKAVDVPAGPAGGNVFDQDNAQYSVIRPNSFQNAAVGYAMADKVTTWTVDFIGHHGSVWFYLDRKPSGTSHYLHLCWVHNWSDSSTTLDSIEIAYPWAVTVNYSSTSSVKQWAGNGSCQKVQLVYQ